MIHSLDKEALDAARCPGCGVTNLPECFCEPCPDCRTAHGGPCKHAPGCGYHLDQYEHECDCGRRRLTADEIRMFDEALFKSRTIIDTGRLA
jgi:hypothetical protein